MRSESFSESTPRAVLLWVLAAFLLKLGLAWIIPITGDEAYFVVWAQHPDFGYYDHPPMVAWLIKLFLPLGQTEVTVRLPVILANLTISVLIYQLLLPVNARIAYLSFLCYLLFPLSLINIFITTDSPLILFSFLSAYFLQRGISQNCTRYYALSGLFLGLAFYSKYFAVLLGIAYLVLFASDIRLRKNWKSGLLLLACALPFGFLNLYWNYTHCWNNILFNLINRNKSSQFDLTGFYQYVLMFALVFLPFLYYFIKSPKQWYASHDKSNAANTRFFIIIALFPFALFLLLSFTIIIGLHWILAFSPFIILLASIKLNEQQLKHSAITFSAISILLCLLLVLTVTVPIQFFKHSIDYQSLVFGKYQQKFLEYIRPDLESYQLASDSYSPASIMAFHLGTDVPVFGRGSYHGRQSDLLTDFRKLHNRKIMIVSKSANRLQRFRKYFDNTKLTTIQLKSANFYLLKGEQFNYPLYRKIILSRIKNDYYSIPDILPYKNCYLFDRYFENQKQK